MAKQEGDLVRLSLDEVHDLATKGLIQYGASSEQAHAVANTITFAERDGCKSHGLFRLPGYIGSLKSGKITGDAIPVLSELAPAVVKVDAANGFSSLPLDIGTAALADKAREQGIAALAITNSHHFAALWPETERLADQGLVAFAFVTAKSYVAPSGGIKPLYGTNPMAFAWPREGKPPMVFDQASSASARGEIMIHERDGQPIPDGWAMDSEGNPTNDPTEALAGAQLPFGGYKGGSIALMVELLAGALIGDVFSFEATANDIRDGGPPKRGEFMIAIDPTRCVSGGGGLSQLAHAETLFAEILDQEGTRLPSDRRYLARQTIPSVGITVPQSLYVECVSLVN